MKDSVKETVEVRRQNYGDYEAGVILRAGLMEGILESYAYNNGGEKMPAKYEGYIHDILNKLIRIAVTPNHIDSWHDIQGYAFRVEEALKRELKDV